MVLPLGERSERWRIQVKRCQVCPARLLIAAAMNLPITTRKDLPEAKINARRFMQLIRRIEAIINIRKHAVEHKHTTSRPPMVVYGAELTALPTNHIDLEMWRIADGSKAEPFWIEGEVLSPLAGRELQPRCEFNQLHDCQGLSNHFQHRAEFVDCRHRIGADTLHANMPPQ
jgi:hypothetical protein